MKLVDLSNPIALARIIANSNANSIAVNATGTAYASQEEGFPHITMIPEDNGGEAPHGLDFNGFLKMLSSHVFNIQNGSPETFNPAVSTLIGGYPKNAQLWLIDDNNSRLLKSTKDDNTDNFLTTPSVIGTSWVDAFPTKDYVDNNFVTLSTAQTITGDKTFTAKISTASLELYPNIGGTRPYIDFHYDNSSSDYTSRIIENTSGELTLQADKVYVPTSTQTTSKSSAEDANIAWVNSTGNNVVHLDSDETITGLKTIRRSALQVTFLDIVNGSITNGVRPSENAHSRIYFSDKDAHATACIYDNFSSNGDNGLYLQALKSETVTQGTDRHFASMGITYPASGNPYGIAPHSDTNGSILTTYTKSKSANGYFRLGNGMIVQWGTSSTSNSSGVFTLPTAFTSTNYAVVMNSVLANVPPSQGSNANVVGWGVVQSRTTTNFTAFLCNYENSFWWRDATKTVTWIAIGY